MSSPQIAATKASISRRLFILQYNVHKFKDIIMAACLRDPEVKRFDIIAIQKSWKNAYTDTTHHPLKDSHILVYFDPKEVKKDKIRMCMFVTKRIPIADLDFQFKTGDMITATIKLSSIDSRTHHLHVHNVYNESDTLSSPAIATIRDALSTQAPEGTNDHIIVGDVNIHHSSWGGIEAHADVRFPELLNLMNEYQLTFNLSRGTTTYIHHQGSEFIIDMCLTTANLTKRVLKCRICPDLDHSSDHLFIETTLNISISIAPPAERFNWDRLNKEKFNGILNQKLSTPPEGEITKDILDTYTEEVSKAMISAMTDFIPKTLASIRATPGFNEACGAARNTTNQTRKSYQQEIAAGNDAQKALVE